MVEVFVRGAQNNGLESDEDVQIRLERVDSLWTEFLKLLLST
jgi:hypothetical protein